MSLKWLPNALTILRCILALAVGWAILNLDRYINLLADVTPDLLELLTDLNEQPAHQKEAFNALLSGGWLKQLLVFLAPFVLYSITALTDWLDGWFARKLNAVTAFGTWLDPIADKFLVAISLFGISHLLDWYWLFLLPALIIVGRDILITLLRYFMDANSLPVTKLAKFKTAAEMIGIGTYLFALALPAIAMLATMSDDGDDTAFIVYPASELLSLVAITLLYIAAALSLYTGWQYMRVALQKPG